MTILWSHPTEWQDQGYTLPRSTRAWPEVCWASGSGGDHRKVPRARPLPSGKIGSPCLSPEWHPGSRTRSGRPESRGLPSLTLPRSSSGGCRDSGTAAMATQASSRGRLAVRGNERLGRRRPRASRGRPRPRLRRPPCPTAAGCLAVSHRPRSPVNRRATRHVLL